VGRLVYKAVPHIYHRVAAEEDLYALVTLGAVLVRRDLSSAIDLHAEPRYSKGRRWGLKRARAAALTVERSDDFAAFMALQARVLERHDAVPTHSAAELELLAGRFPERISLHVVRSDGDLIAGVVLYETPHVTHTQYIAAGQRGRELSALDLLLDALIERARQAGRRWFDFGISTYDEGRRLNAGLLRHKESFGAGAVAYDRYALDI
jgi:hypothetical protein